MVYGNSVHAILSIGLSCPAWTFAAPAYVTAGGAGYCMHNHSLKSWS